MLRAHSGTDTIRIKHRIFLHGQFWAVKPPKTCLYNRCIELGYHQVTPASAVAADFGNYWYLYPRLAGRQGASAALKDDPKVGQQQRSKGSGDTGTGDGPAGATSAERRRIAIGTYPIVSLDSLPTRSNCRALPVCRSLSQAQPASLVPTTSAALQVVHTHPEGRWRHVAPPPRQPAVVLVGSQSCERLGTGSLCRRTPAVTATSLTRTASERGGDHRQLLSMLVGLRITTRKRRVLEVHRRRRVPFVHASASSPTDLQPPPRAPRRHPTPSRHSRYLPREPACSTTWPPTATAPRRSAHIPR